MMTAGTHVIIIADWDNNDGTSIRIQNFERDGQLFIPVFTSQAAFDTILKDNPYADKGVSIDLEILLGTLKGDEELVFKPGSGKSWRLTGEK